MDAVPGLSQVHSAALRELLQGSSILPRLAAGFAANGHQLFLVGGSVRDALLGRLGTDLDFTTDARPDAIEATLRQITRSTWDVGREFGTIGAQSADESGREWTIEVTT